MAFSISAMRSAAGSPFRSMPWLTPRISTADHVLCFVVIDVAGVVGEFGFHLAYGLAELHVDSIGFRVILEVHGASSWA